LTTDSFLGRNAVQTRDIEYRADGARLVGYLAVDDSKSGKRPGVLVAHEGFGLNENAKNFARRLAELGYVAFALDYHGDGKPLTDINLAMKRIQGWIADPTGSLARGRAGLEILVGQKETDPTRLAGIGYCFGGTLVLDMARSGEDLKAVVGFHSGLATGRPAAPGRVKSKVLVQIGVDDPVIPPEQRLAFEKEMTAAGVDWRMILYSGAGHSFTNPDSNRFGRPGFAYHEPSDRRSWRAMIDAFDEVF
jgi:dienelactone hydrolase